MLPVSVQPEGQSLFLTDPQTHAGIFRQRRGLIKSRKSHQADSPVFLRLHVPEFQSMKPAESQKPLRPGSLNLHLQTPFGVMFQMTPHRPAPGTQLSMETARICPEIRMSSRV